VLLFGQSAGAADAFALATLLQSHSLISAVALQSGGGRSLVTVQQVTHWNRRFIQQLGRVNAACLRSVSLHDLNNTTLHPNGSDGSSPVPPAQTLLMNAGKRPTWGPVVDGTVIPIPPLTAGLRVPAIAGSTTREGTLFVLGTYLARAFTLNQTDYDAFLTSNFGPLAADIKTVYPLSSFSSSSPNTTSPSDIALHPAY
jgi:carboxylesterase type B